MVKQESPVVGRTVVFALTALFVVSAARTDAQPEDALPGGDGVLGIHFLDVGQGDATLVVCPNGDRILVDAGSLPLPTAVVTERYRQSLLELLDPVSPFIDTLVVTHPDGDHFGLLPKMLRGVRVGAVLLGDRVDRYGDSSWNGEQIHNGGTWLRSIADTGRVTALPRDHHDLPASPSGFFDCGEADVHILAASVEESSVPAEWQPERSSQLNARSVVLRIDYGDFETILTGDATMSTEYKILHWYDHGFLDVEVLKIGHHGSSATSTRAEWAKATAPRTAVVSAGHRNQYGHPRDIVVTRLEEYVDVDDPHEMTWAYYQSQRRRWKVEDSYAKSIYSTSATGTIRVFSDGEFWWVEE